MIPKTMEGKMTDKKDWEERFDKECEWVFHDPDCRKYEKIEVDDTGGKKVIGYFVKNDCCCGEFRRKEIKGFIRSLLKSKRQELKKKVEGMRHNQPFTADIEFSEGYQQAKDQILTLLEEYER